jgi:V/A-type H+-transporting ATPase subunit A
LQQNALDPIDTYCSPQKQFRMLKIIVDFYRCADRIVSKGAPIFKIAQLPITEDIMRMKETVTNDKVQTLDDLETRMQKNFENLEASLR